MSRNYWFISDTHFQHQNIMLWSPGPCSSLEERDEMIIDKGARDSSLVTMTTLCTLQRVGSSRRWAFGRYGMTTICYSPMCQYILALSQRDWAVTGVLMFMVTLIRMVHQTVHTDLFV